MAAARKEVQQTIQEVARRLLKQAKGDVDAAATMFERAVRDDSRLRDELTEPLIAGACRDAIRREIQDNRRDAWRGDKVKVAPPARPGPAASQSQRIIQLATGTLLMFPLPGGKLLSAATRAEVADASAFYQRQSADMGAKGRWLRLIAQSVPDGKTVGDILTDQRLRELQSEAQRDA